MKSMIEEINVLDNTSRHIPIGGTSVPTAFSQNLITQYINQVPTVMVLDYFVKANNIARSSIDFNSSYLCLPLVTGSDGVPVFLYQIIESIDENLDYDNMLLDNPTLSKRQIIGSVMFLRQLAHFNTKGLDMDEVEECVMEDLTGLQHSLRNSQTNGGEEVVFTSGKS